MRFALAAAVVALLAASHAAAAIPSCYALTKIAAPAPLPERHVFVLIDQTTPIDAPLKAAIRNNLGPLLTPGTGFTISTFSAFAQGHYQAPLADGELERSVPTKLRDDVSVRALEALDRCLARQLAFGRRAAAKALDDAIAGQSAALEHSDVISSLVDLSKSVSASAAPDRIVVVVSDMLENSGLTSFYAHRTIRSIDPKAEMRKVRDKEFLADFHRARVFVIGAGALPGEGNYRDPVAMSALEHFWRDYFSASHATLVDFGKPMPTRPAR